MEFHDICQAGRGGRYTPGHLACQYNERHERGDRPLNGDSPMNKEGKEEKEGRNEGKA